MKRATSGRHRHLDIYVFAASNIDSVNKSKVYYINWYLRIHAPFQCCINLLFSDRLLYRHGSIYYYVRGLNTINTLSAKQRFKILLKGRSEQAILRNDPRDELWRRHVKGRVEDPHSFRSDSFLAYLDHFV